MKSVNWVIAFLTIAGFFSIQFSTLIDDPQHFIESDPNCPICIAAKTEVCISPHLSIDFAPHLISLLIDTPVYLRETTGYSWIISIRAPPCS